MERILLYLDDFDDVVFALAFLGERRGQFLRRGMRRLSVFLASSATAWLAFALPAAGSFALMSLSAVVLLRGSAAA